MNIEKGTKKIKNNTITAIAELEIKDYRVYVFPGSLSENDFLIKYSKAGTRMRTPKHIHWVTDILMKLQGNPKLTKSFLQLMKTYWDNCKPLQNNDFESIKKIVECEFNSNEYADLNRYGEYDIEFVFSLIRLLSVQEKTNRSDAYMFGNILNELLKDSLDIFKIISTAGFSRR